MPLSEFQEYVVEQLEGAGTVRTRAMFGGVGVYVDEVFCAILSGSSRFYLRVDDGNRKDFEAQEMEQFPGRGGAGMPYFEVPTEVLDDREQLATWALAARDAALRSKKAPKKRKR